MDATKSHVDHINAALQAASIYYRDEIVPGTRRTYGKKWRDALRLDWMRASYPSALADHSGTLQLIRNMRDRAPFNNFRADWE